MDIPVESKQQHDNTSPDNPFENKQVAVIGTGLVGKAWAIIFARGGCKVNLYDSLPDAAANSLAPIKQIASDLHKVGLLRKCKSPDELLERIKVSTSLKEAVSGAFWVQECVPENLEFKTKLFTELDSAADKQTILASSTSAIPCSSFTKQMNTKERCIVAHPVNPPYLIPLVEVVPSPFTSPEIPQITRQFMEAIGQSPVLVKKEVHSFVLNRLQGALLNEAWRLVEDGVIDADDLDKTVRDGLGLRWSFMGPFETIDLNAPGGVKDYVERYSGNMYELAQQQADSRRWQGQVVDKVVEERRNLLPIEKLPERGKWRDARLMALVAHKTQISEAEKAQK